MVVVVVVAVAGVIFVVHGHGHGDVYVYDRDHHSPLRSGASIHRGKAPFSAAFRDVAALVAGLGGEANEAWTSHAATAAMAILHSLRRLPGR